MVYFSGNKTKIKQSDKQNKHKLKQTNKKFPMKPKKTGSFIGPADDQSGRFPKAGLPLCPQPPKAGAQGTESLCASSHQKGQQTPKHEAQGLCGRGQVRPAEVLQVSLVALCSTAAGVLTPARN